MEHTFKTFGTMLDCSRNAVMTVESVKRWIDLTAKLGCNTLHLYMEDTYEVDGQPYFGHLRGRYSKAELKQIDAYAAAHGMQVIPCIQTLAHVNALFHWPVYREIHDAADILLTGDERTYALVDGMFRTLRECLRTNIVNIGMDEADLLGLGKYLTLHGYRDRFSILMEHLRRVSEMAKKYGFELLMWGDMFFRLAGGDYFTNFNQDPKLGEIPEEVRQLVPENIHLVYWDYFSRDRQSYERNIDAHNAIKSGSWFAGGLWTWAGFAPHNTFSIATMREAMKACHAKGVENVVMTMWGDNGAECSKFAVLPALFTVSQMAQDIDDVETIHANFEREFGIPFEDFRALDLIGTQNDSAEAIYNCSATRFLRNSDRILEKKTPVLRNISEARSLASAAPKTAGRPTQEGGLFRLREGRLLPPLSLPFRPPGEVTLPALRPGLLRAPGRLHWPLRARRTPSTRRPQAPTRCRQSRTSTSCRCAIPSRPCCMRHALRGAVSTRGTPRGGSRSASTWKGSPRASGSARRR